jgi:hypothetical protein
LLRRESQPEKGKILIKIPSAEFIKNIYRYLHRVITVKLDVCKNALATDAPLNDRVLSFFEAQGISLVRILTDRGAKYYGR